MELLSSLLVSLGFVLPPPYENDRKKLVKIYSQLVEIERRLQKEGVKPYLVDKLNALGYPIHVIYTKYAMRKDKSEPDHKLYGMSRKVYEEYLLVKRTIFPVFVKMDASRNRIPLCAVELRGKEKDTIVVRVRQESDKKRLLDSTQLRYAHRLGFTRIDFLPCGK
ncbi:MAG: hypothetical protein GXO04_04420 [Aquificae bacterium]|nr:hypothetical protein [Aquificota bacterium]